MRTSSIRIDSRINLPSTSLTFIQEAVRRRIYVRGLNALDQQMDRAQDPPFSLYRYETGDLRNNTKVIQVQNSLVLQVNYPDVIINTLEDKYGPIFYFSNSDRKTIKSVCEGYLLDNDIDPETLETFDRENTESRNSQIETVEREKEPLKKPSYINRSESVILYDNKATISREDLQNIKNFVINRIIKERKDSRGYPIPNQLHRLIRKENIEVIRPSSGRIILRYTYNFEELYQQKQIFDWSVNEVQYIDSIVDMKLSSLGIQKTKATIKI